MVFVFVAMLFLVTRSLNASLLSDFANETLTFCPGVFDCKSNFTGRRICSCDDDCAWKGTCCYDAPAYDRELTIKYSDRIKCRVNRRMLFGCDEGWGKDEIQELCEAADPDHFWGSSDPLLHLPVRSKETGIVYPNYYCAVCNQDVEDISVLDYSFACDVPEEFEGILQPTLQEALRAGVSDYERYHGDHYSYRHWSKHGMADDNRIMSGKINVTYNEMRWLTTLQVREGYHSFSCSAAIDQNDQCECEYTEHISWTDKCDPRWKDTEVEDLCRSFKGGVLIGSSLSTLLDRGYNTTYKNVFCAICNFLCIRDLCDGIGSYCPYYQREYSFTVHSGSSAITRKHSVSTCKEDEDFFPGYCHGGENKLLCVLSPSYHRTPLCVKRDKDKRVNSYLARGRNEESHSETTMPHLGYSMSDFVKQTLSYCPGVFDCKSNSNKTNSLNTYSNCDCDDDCLRRNTCCYDAPAYDKDLALKNSGRTKCILNAEMFFGCDVGWEDVEVQKMCEVANIANLGKTEEPILHLPVTSKKTNTTYPNYYCAICNHDSEDIIVWSNELVCDNWFDNSTTVSLQSILQKVLDTGAEENGVQITWATDMAESNSNYCRNAYFNEGYYWVIKFNNTDIKLPRVPEMTPILDHINCHLSLEASNRYLENAPRQCCAPWPNEIDTCHPLWNNKEVEDLCRSFKGTISVYGPLTTYRNVFCAICNGAFDPSTENVCHGYQALTCTRIGVRSEGLKILLDSRSRSIDPDGKKCYPSICAGNKNPLTCPRSSQHTKPICLG